MSINEYITKEMNTIGRMKEEYGDLTAHLVAEDFYLNYTAKHPYPSSVNDPVQPYFNRRAEVFDRYVRREWKV